MIIIDIETSGLDPRRHCMLSLGAVDYETGREFYGECSVYNDSEIDPIAMEMNGFKTKDVVASGKKPPAHMLYGKFTVWAKGCSDNILAGHNVGHFDILFLEHYHEGFSIPFPFSYRTVDLHSIAYYVFGRSMKHSDICLALGLPPEPKPHNALSGARSEAAAFRELFKMHKQWPDSVK